MVRGWAERTPDGFVMHVKAFGLMTRHPVKLEQVPPDLREGLPVDERGRVDRPTREARARRLPRVPRRARPLRDTGKLGGILFQMPPYVVWKPSSLDYLEWAHDQLGGDRMLFEPRHRSWFEEDVRKRAPALARGAARWRGSSSTRRRSTRRTCRETLVATTTPIAYVRFHGRNAGTWNARGGSAAQRFDHLYGEDELREWVGPLRELVEQARGGVRVLQQQQPDERRRAGAGRRAAAAQAARGGERPDRMMRVLAVIARARRPAGGVRRRDRRGRARARRVGHPLAWRAAASESTR